MFRSARSSCSIYATWEICKSLPEEKCLQRLSWLLCSVGRQPRGLPWKVRCNIFEIKLTCVITIDERWPYDENQAQYGENNIQDIKNAKRFLKWFWTKHKSNVDSIPWGWNVPWARSISERLQRSCLRRLEKEGSIDWEIDTGDQVDNNMDGNWKYIITDGHVLHAIVLGSNGETPSQTTNQQDCPLVSWKGILIVDVWLWYGGFVLKIDFFYWWSWYRLTMAKEAHLPSVDNDGQGRDGNA